MKKATTIQIIFSALIIPIPFLISCEKKPKLPVIITAEITNITTISAVSGGEISDDGGTPLISKGICWNTADNPTIADNYITETSDNTSFTGTLDGLSPKAPYFVRAFAINSAGTGYGEAKSFTTLGDTPASVTVDAENISINSAVLNGTVNPYSLITTVTFQWGITTDYGNTIIPVQSPVTGSESKNLSAEITGLSPGTTYHFRIKAENSLGVNYSSGMSFKTLGCVPEITSPDASDITVNTARLTTSVNPNYLTTSVAFEWGTSASYGNTATLQNAVTGSNSVNLTTALSGLTPQTTYHYRIVATNELGTKMTNDMSFTTYTVADLENNFYHSVTIGNQVWLAENLKSTKFNDGTPIPLITGQNDWDAVRSYAYCWYNNSYANKGLYGALYNRWAADRFMNSNKNICPSGWHVPAKAEWSELLTFLTNNGFGNDGSGNDIAKSLAAKTEWNLDLSTGTVGNNPEANNSSGFTALPGGKRTDGAQGFIRMGTFGSWWGDPNDAPMGYSYWCTSISSYSGIVYQENTSSNSGLSVRCIKD